MHTLNGTNSVRKLIRDNISSGANGSDAFTSTYFVIASALYLSPLSTVSVEWNGRGNGEGVGTREGGEFSVKLSVKTGKSQVKHCSAAILSSGEDIFNLIWRADRWGEQEDAGWSGWVLSVEYLPPVSWWRPWFRPFLKIFLSDNI